MVIAKCVELDIPVWPHTAVNFAPSLSPDFGRPIYLDEAAGHFPSGSEVRDVPLKPSVKEKWLGETAGRLLDLEIRAMRKEKEKT